MKSLLQMAVMSLLVERPSYVYDVAQRFDERFGDLMPRSAATIYRLVDQLEANGLVEGMGADGPRRKTYRATRRGARAYTASLTEQMSGEPVRLELVTRMLSAAAAGRAGPLLDVLDSFERECLDEATRLPPTPAAGDPAADDYLAVVRQLVAEERRLAIGVHLRWIRFARRRIQRLGQGPSPVGHR